MDFGVMVMQMNRLCTRIPQYLLWKIIILKVEPITYPQTSLHPSQEIFLWRIWSGLTLAGIIKQSYPLRIIYSIKTKLISLQLDKEIGQAILMVIFLRLRTRLFRLIHLP